MPERYQFTGLKELRDTMLKLPKEIRGRPLRDALFSAAKIIRDEAVRLAPHATGRLAMNIVVAPMRKEELLAIDEGVVVAVRQKGKKGDAHNAFYWRFIEFGHRVRPRRGAAGTEAYKSTGRGAYGTGGFQEARTTRRLNADLSRYGRSQGARLSATSAPAQFIPARPFMRPAFESRKQEAVAVFAIKFKVALEKALKKVRRVR